MNTQDNISINPAWKTNYIPLSGGHCMYVSIIHLHLIPSKHYVPYLPPEDIITGHILSFSLLPIIY